MSWRDRDYAREDDAGYSLTGSFTGIARGHSTVKILIAINVAVYVLCILTAGPRGAIVLSPLFKFAYMFTPYVMEGQVWRIITADYLHWTTTHIIFNMIGLYFLGRPLEQLWGPRRFFIFYTIAGAIGMLFYMALNTLGWFDTAIAVGASGSVLGLLGAAAVLFPHAEIMIYFLFPVKIRIVAIVLGAGYLLNIYSSGPNAGGDACHVAGLLYGVWWAMRGERWWGRFRRDSRNRRVARGSFNARIEQRSRDAETIDRILAKVHSAGVAALSDSEKRALADASQRQREEELRFDRNQFP